MLNLDTHVLLHALGGTLRPREARLLGADRWSIAAIVLWEVAKLAQLRRIALDLDDPDVVRALASLHVWPLTREIAVASTRLDVSFSLPRSGLLRLDAEIAYQLVPDLGVVFNGTSPGIRDAIKGYVQDALANR